MLNEFNDTIGDGSEVFPTYPPPYPGARQRSTFFKIIPSIKLRRGLCVFLNMPGFCILTNPTNYGACYIVLWLDAEFAYVIQLADHYKEAAESENDASFLYPLIQDPETPEENWDVQLSQRYKIPLSDSYFIVSNTSNFVAVVMDESNNFTDGPRLRDALESFKPALVLTSDDFNQSTVPTMGSLAPGAPLSNAPEVSRSAAQQREDALLGNLPQTTAATKRTADAASLRFLGNICRNNMDRLEVLLGPSRSVTGVTPHDNIQELFTNYSHLQGLVAISAKMLPKFLAGSFAAHQSGQPSSISTCEFGSGVTIASFQKNSIDPLNTTNKYVQQPFTKAWAIENAVSHLVDILNMFAYGEVSPDYSVWTQAFARYRDQLKNGAAMTAAMEPGLHVVTILVHLLNKSLHTFAAALKDDACHDYTDRQWIEHCRFIFRFDDKAVIAEAASKQPPIPQFSNYVVWKKAVVADNVIVANPIIADKNKNKKRKDEEVNPSPAKEKKVKVDKKDQICIANFQFQTGIKPVACNNKRNNGKCERKHIPAPANGVKWDKDVLDKISAGAQSFDQGTVKDAILAMILTLR